MTHLSKMSRYTIFLLIIGAALCANEPCLALTIWLSETGEKENLVSDGSNGSFGIWMDVGNGERVSDVTFDIRAVGNAIEFRQIDLEHQRSFFNVRGVGEIGETLIEGVALGSIGFFAGIEDTGTYLLATVEYETIAGGQFTSLQLANGFSPVSPHPLELRFGVGHPTIDNFAGNTDSAADGLILLVPEPGGLLISVLGSFTCAIFWHRCNRP